MGATIFSFFPQSWETSYCNVLFVSLSLLYLSSTIISKKFLCSLACSPFKVHICPQSHFCSSTKCRLIMIKEGTALQSEPQRISAETCNEESLTSPSWVMTPHDDLQNVMHETLYISVIVIPQKQPRIELLHSVIEIIKIIGFICLTGVFTIRH